MKKAIIYISMALLLCVFSAQPAMALPSGFDAYTAEYKSEDYPRVIDKAGLLTDVEEKSLISRINGIVEEYSFGVAIVATDSLEGMDVTAYSEAVFDECGYGVGADRDGLLFLISIEERDWNIDAHAYGAAAFNNYGREKIGGLIQPLLSGGDYAGAFSSFLDYVDIFLAEAAAGEPFSSENPYLNAMDILAILPVTFAVSLIIALIVALIMKWRMKTARPKPLAREYIKQGSFRLTGQNDMFLYSSVDKTLREKSSSSSSSKGSGSHSHTKGKF